MRISLLANPVPAPNGGDVLKNWSRKGFLLGKEFAMKHFITAMVAISSLSFALLRVCVSQHESLERVGVGEALHDCVEKTSVAMVDHAVTHFGLLLFFTFFAEQVCLHIV